MKVGIVGAGTVGTACLMSVVARGFASEVVVVNRDRKRAKGVVTDLQYGATLGPHTVLRDGDYGELAGAAVVLVTAGVNEKTGGATNRSNPAGRLRLLDTNAEAYRQIVPGVHEAAPGSVIVVVTNPPDPLADVVRKLGHERVVSTGTYLDTLRFRFHIARKLQVNPAQVEALVLGEHGTSEVFVWSSARVGGAPLGELLATDSARREIRGRGAFREHHHHRGHGGQRSRHRRGLRPDGGDDRSRRECGHSAGVVEPRLRSDALGPHRRRPRRSNSPTSPGAFPAERQALEKSAETLRSVVSRLRL